VCAPLEGESYPQTVSAGRGLDNVEELSAPLVFRLFNFEQGSHELLPQHKTKIGDVLAHLKELDPTVQVRRSIQALDGFASVEGTAKRNQSLAARRARAVYDALVAGDDEQATEREIGIKLVAFGETKEHGEDYGQNRCVAVELRGAEEVTFEEEIDGFVFANPTPDPEVQGKEKGAQWGSIGVNVLQEVLGKFATTAASGILGLPTMIVNMGIGFAEAKEQQPMAAATFGFCYGIVAAACRTKKPKPLQNYENDKEFMDALDDYYRRNFKRMSDLYQRAELRMESTKGFKKVLEKGGLDSYENPLVTMGESDRKYFKAMLKMSYQPEVALNHLFRKMASGLPLRENWNHYYLHWPTPKLGTPQIDGETAWSEATNGDPYPQVRWD
jgi:hypothetical protein